MMAAGESPQRIKPGEGMKKSGFAAMAASLLLACTGCTVVSPDAGQQAVLIDKPILFGHGGVRDQPVTTGLTYTWFSTNRIYVNMFPQQYDRDQPVTTGLTYTWFSTNRIYVNMFPQQYDGNFGDLMSSDGVPLDFHAIIRLQVVDPVVLVKNFG
jgi:hypothetical protein